MYFLIVLVALGYFLILAIAFLGYYAVKVELSIIHYTHFILGLIFAVMLMSIEIAISFFLYLSSQLNPSTVFFLSLLGIGVSLPNSYYLSQIIANSKGIQESTIQPNKQNP